LFVECSARSSNNIDKVFNDIAILLIKKKEEDIPPVTHRANINPSEPKPNKCC
jgi:hypothetical protein